MKDEIREKIERHRMWCCDEPGGERANLSEAYLSRANLSGANLSEANLSEAYLSRANLSWANLSEAYLSRANLSWAYLIGADLSGADLSGADLSGANLSRANLSGADLKGANLYNANLYLARGLDSVLTDASTLFWELQCPSKGAYTAFKKAGGLIVELLIPEDALRTSATSSKCRASKAVVTGISNLDGSPAAVREVQSNYNANFWYRVGETVEVNDFFQDRWKECAPGIHHFITREEAVDYVG